MQKIEETTLKLLKERNPQFLTQLFSETSPYLLKMLASQGVYGEQAQDLVQSSWETFFKSIETFEGRSQIKVYLGGILINKIREHRRSLKKLVMEEDPETIMNNAFTPEGWWKLDPVPPDELLASKQIAHHIQDCIEGLTQAQKSAFVLREVESEETEDVCKILGVSTSHLGVLIFRAKDKLRKCLEGKVRADA